MVWASEGWGRSGSVSQGPPSTVGLIQNFTSVNGGTFTVDGVTVSCATTHTWSLTQIDSYTVRMEVRSGDVWSSGSYTDPITSERCEVEAGYSLLSAGQLLNWEAIVTVLAGSPIATQALILQCHATPENNTPCPLSIQIEGGTGKLQIVGQEPNNTWYQLYLGPSAIVRGSPMDIKVKVKMGATGNSGSVFITLNGTTIVNNAALNIGASSGAQFYWKWGIYRTATPETLQIEFSHVHMYFG